MKVLVIEDDPAIVENLSLAFEMRWPETSLVSTHLGSVGIELASSETPDIIVLDLGLPDMSGFEVLKEVRRFSNVPVVIVTAMSEETDMARGLECGADDFVVKPFKQLDLLARMKLLVGQ